MSRLLVMLGLRLSVRRKLPAVPGVDLSVSRFLKPRLSVALGDVLYLDERWVLRIYAMSSVRQNCDYSVSLLLFGPSSKGRLPCTSNPLLRSQLSGSSLSAFRAAHFS